MKKTPVGDGKTPVVDGSRTTGVYTIVIIIIIIIIIIKTPAATVTSPSSSTVTGSNCIIKIPPRTRYQITLGRNSEPTTTGTYSRKKNFGDCRHFFGNNVTNTIKHQLFSYT